MDENSNNYRRVNKVLFGDKTGNIKTFCVLSVENPLGWKASTEEEFKKKFVQWFNDKKLYNEQSIQSIKSSVLLHIIEQNGETALRYSGANYVPLKGKYNGASEKSFMIFNITLDDSKQIAQDYGQESFFFGKVNSNENAVIGYYVTHNACKTYNLIEVNNKIENMKNAIDMFSKYGFKFKFSFKALGDAVEPIMNNDEFEASLNEDSTFMSRAMHRRYSRHKREGE